MRVEPVALLLPGMTLNATIFPDLGIPAVSPDFNRLVVGPDGETPELLDQRMGFYAGRLEAFLQSSGAWAGKRRIIVAHSFGGMLALWWLTNGAAESLTGVQGIVLVATTAGPMYQRLGLRLGSGRRAVRLAAAPLLPIWNLPAITRVVKRVMCGGTLDTDIVDFRAHEIDSDWALDRAGWRNTDWRAMRSYRLAIEGFDVRSGLGRIDLPSIVLHGTRDSLFDASVARELVDGLPHAELRLVKGAGHALPITHGPEVVRAVRDLLGR